MNAVSEVCDTCSLIIWFIENKSAKDNILCHNVYGQNRIDVVEVRWSIYCHFELWQHCNSKIQAINKLEYSPVVTQIIKIIVPVKNVIPPVSSIWLLVNCTFFITNIGYSKKTTV